MARKSMKDAATQGVSVFDVIATGNTQNVENVPAVQDVQNVQAVKEKPQLERLNLKIPADIKAYLQAAAYRESSPQRIVSLTEYLCDLVRADMERHKDD